MLTQYRAMAVSMKKTELLYKINPFVYMRDRHLMSFVMAVYGLAILGIDMTNNDFGVSYIMGVNVSTFSSGVFLVSGWWLLFGKPSAKRFLIASQPQMFYTAFTLQEYLNSGNVSVSELSLHVVVSVFLLYIIYQKA